MQAQKWESDEWAKIREHRRYDNPSTWYFSAYCLAFFVFAMFLLASSKFRFIFDIFAFVGISRFFIKLLVLILAVCALFVSLIGFYRYYMWKPVLRLSSRKQKLFGLPPAQDKSGENGSQEKPPSQHEAARPPVPKNVALNGLSSTSLRSRLSGFSEVIASPQRQMALNEREIVDSKSLNQYLNDFNKTQQQMVLADSPARAPTTVSSSPFLASPLTSRPLHSRGFANLMGSPSPFKTTPLSLSPAGPSSLFSPDDFRYTTSYREAVPKMKKSDDILIDPEVADNILAQESYELYVREGVENKIDIWEDNLRQWMYGFILKPIVTKLKESDAFFERTRQEVSGNANVLNQLQPDDRELLANPPSSHALAKFFIRVAPQLPEVKFRQQLHKYLDVSGEAVRAYVAQRIRELSQGYNTIAAYNYNGGSDWNGKPWQASLPTDAQILLHLFCTFLDFSCKSLDWASFASRFLIHHNSSEAKDKNTFAKPLVILQSGTDRPYFYLICEQGKQRWTIKPGSSNLFHVIVMLLFYVKTRLGGKLDGMNFGDDSLKLFKIIAN
eukprot:TRINITY_DN11710_c0_g1_i6.p1 TRINITY_DN11710_c0_g1~~TRINITY_DN11710_c0_g1_i6.p1  ORF type:complete len:584 (+),score=132.36 TRINITY_DN11710_c0_g1_i6:85-1752(+)